MSDDQDKKKARVKWIKRISLIIAGLFLLYVLIGFWVVPPLLKPKLEEQLSSLLGRKVTIDMIKLNPLVLSATTSNLTIYENEGEPFAGFQELFVDAQLSSIVKWALTVRQIRIKEPFGVLKLLPDNKLNIDDILAKLSERKSEPKQDAGLPRAVIEKLEFIDGRATIEDLTGKEPIREVVSPIAFTLENLSTLKGRQGEYRFVGAEATPRQAPKSVTTGNISRTSSPFKSSKGLRLQPVITQSRSPMVSSMPGLKTALTNSTILSWSKRGKRKC